MPFPSRSSLYECEVVHQRLSPKRHGFRYRLFFIDIDLAELDLLSRRLWLFGRGRFRLYGFRDGDHLDYGQGEILANLRHYLQAQGLTLAEDARVRLITLPRIMGYIFNPVCFYFITDVQGQPLHAIAEVTNTFHEMKLYLMPEVNSEGCFELIAPKHFYVSPYSSLDTSFHFRLSPPGESMRIHIDDLDGGQRSLVSWITGQRRPLTDLRLLWYLLRYPLLTVQVIIKIHWQALRLWWLGVAFHRKSDHPELQRDLMRPHGSIPTAHDP
jgi:uncharacterized protein